MCHWRAHTRFPAVVLKLKALSGCDDFELFLLPYLHRVVNTLTGFRLAEPVVSQASCDSKSTKCATGLLNKKSRHRFACVNTGEF